MSLYPEEFRTEVIAHYQRVAGEFPSASAAGQWVAREYDICLDTVRRWCKDAGVWDGYSSVAMRKMAAEIAVLRAQLESGRHTADAAGHTDPIGTPAPGTPD